MAKEEKEILVIRLNFCMNWYSTIFYAHKDVHDYIKNENTEKIRFQHVTYSAIDNILKRQSDRKKDEEETWEITEAEKEAFINYEKDAIIAIKKMQDDDFDEESRLRATGKCDKCGTWCYGACD